jgi:type II secretory pathway component PulF
MDIAANTEALLYFMGSVGLTPLVLTLMGALGFALWLGWVERRRRRLRMTVLDHLAILTRHGLPLGGGLIALAKERAASRGRRARDEALAIRGIGERFEATASLADALASKPVYFPAEIVSLVRVAEEKGAIPEAVLVLVRDEHRHENAIYRLIERSAYPIVLIFAILWSATFMTEFLEPRFDAIASGMGIPGGRAATAASVTAVFVLGLTAVAIVLALMLQGGAPGRVLSEVAARALSAVPVIGPPIRARRNARWLARTAAFLATGATLPEALAAAASVARGKTARTLADAARLAREGNPLPLVLAPALGRDASTLVAPIVLETRANGLAAALASTAERIGSRSERRLDTIASTLRPIPIGVAGSIVAIHAWAIWGSIQGVEAFILRSTGP